MASDVRVQATPATRIYATSFQIRQPGRSAADTLSDAALTTLRWAGDENQSWIDGRQLTPKGEVVAETAAGSGLDVRHMNLSHPDHAQPGVHWRTSLDLVRIANRVEIYCQLTRRDPSGDPN